MSERELGPGGSRFDPTRYLRQLRGRGGTSDYLDVKWRLVWLRSEHPDAQISTEHITIAGDSAVFKATVAIPGGGSATGYGSETAKDFGDFIEKAETKALGRALLALGYGTQFAQDFGDDDSLGAGGAEAGPRRVESAPARPASASGADQAPPRVNPAPRPPRLEATSPAPGRPAPVRSLRETEADEDAAPLPVAPIRPEPAPRAPQPAPRPADDDDDFGAVVARTPAPAAELPPASRPAARLSAPQPAPRPVPRPAPAPPAARGGEDDEDGEIDMANYGWTEFWSWARARGYHDRKALDAVVGRQTTGMTPLEIRKQIQAKQG